LAIGATAAVSVIVVGPIFDCEDPPDPQPPNNTASARAHVAPARFFRLPRRLDAICMDREA